MEEKKITQEELEELQELNKQSLKTTELLGVNEFNISKFKKQRIQLIDNLEEIEAKGKVLTRTLGQKYGNNIEIDLDTGYIK